MSDDTPTTADFQGAHIDALERELKERAAINTNVRLFDLVRYMRSELHEAGLITDEEYAWLVAEAPMAKGSGSPSPRRLEDYDAIKGRLAAAQIELLESKATINLFGSWLDHWSLREQKPSDVYEAWDDVRERAKEGIRL